MDNDVESCVKENPHTGINRCPPARQRAHQESNRAQRAPMSCGTHRVTVLTAVETIRRTGRRW